MTQSISTIVEHSVSESDAIRRYLVTLRTAQGIGQEATAEAAGLASRTYKGWELGEIKDMKGAALVRTLRFLGGNFDDLDSLATMTEAEAEARAREWLATPNEQRTNQVRSGVRRIIELGDRDPDRLRQVVERLRDDSRADPVILDMVMGFLDGRRSLRQE